MKIFNSLNTLKLFRENFKTYKNLAKPVLINKIIRQDFLFAKFINNIFDNLQSGCRKFFFTFMKKNVTVIWFEISIISIENLISISMDRNVLPFNNN